MSALGMSGKGDMPVCPWCAYPVVPAAFGVRPFSGGDESERVVLHPTCCREMSRSLREMDARDEVAEIERRELLAAEAMEREVTQRCLAAREMVCREWAS